MFIDQFSGRLEWNVALLRAQCHRSRS
jgi:hypothetical protein